MVDTRMDDFSAGTASKGDLGLPHRTTSDGPTTGEGPTTENGPLSGQLQTRGAQTLDIPALDAQALDNRLISAHYSSPEAARDARAALIQAGIAENVIAIVAHAAEDGVLKAATRPADDTLLGRVREVILPDEATAAARHAIDHDDAILTVTPLRGQVEIVVRIIEATKPSRFDADLERWRNKG